MDSNEHTGLRLPGCQPQFRSAYFGLHPIHDISTYGISRTKVNKLSYRTTSNDYGKYPPTKAMLPTSSHPRTNDFVKNHIPKSEEGRMNQ